MKTPQRAKPQVPAFDIPVEKVREWTGRCVVPNDLLKKSSAYGAQIGAQHMLDEIISFLDQKGFSREDTGRLKDHFTPFPKEELSPYERAMALLSTLEMRFLNEGDNDHQHMIRRLRDQVQKLKPTSPQVKPLATSSNEP